MDKENAAKIHIVIGKNFGDEGKGLAVDCFAMRAQKKGVPCLVIRHNGGAQAGHSVDLRDRIGSPKDRFVFHQLSAGSLRGADTMWAETFLPDLYKLREERDDFIGFAGREPRISASPACRCVTVDDVLLNMALETVRGRNRHGSCGMGINEAVVRSQAEPFRITLGEILGGTAEDLLHKLERNRREYLPLRLMELEQELGGSTRILRAAGEYGELLRSGNVLMGAAEEMCRGALIPRIAGPEEVLPAYGEIIFEGAQGLLLDEKNPDYRPYLTSSRTGLHNPVCFLERYEKAFSGEMRIDGCLQAEAVYVTRTYVTRHGAGPLPYEELFDRELFKIKDRTNLPNTWQGALRFAPHGTQEEFVREVVRDLQDSPGAGISPALFLTHGDETGEMVCSRTGLCNYENWFGDPHLQAVFACFYYAGTPFAEDVKE